MENRRPSYPFWKHLDNKDNRGTGGEALKIYSKPMRYRTRRMRGQDTWMLGRGVVRNGAVAVNTAGSWLFSYANRHLNLF